MFNVDAIDQDLKANGVWEEFEGGSFLIAHTSNSTFQRELTRLQQPHRKKIDKGTLGPEMAKTILCGAMGKGLLLDWKELGDADGTTVKYSMEAAIKLLKMHDGLREFVEEISQNLDNFRTEEIEDAKN